MKGKVNMYNITHSPKGITIEYTSTLHGCLEVGGVCGRKYFYKYNTISQHMHPHQLTETSAHILGHVLDADWIMHNISPDRVLCHGTKIK